MVMNEDVIQIAYTQFSDWLGLLGLLAIFFTPIIAGGITAYISHKGQTKITNDVWEHWRNNKKFQNQKVTTSINYNE